ncbi:hypothetical protein LCGC14_2913390, partial [marine sediment metagenome]
ASEVLIETGAAAIDVGIIRPVMGVFEGVVEAGGQLVRELGGTETSARQFVRDTRALLTAAVVAAGTGPLGGRGVRKAREIAKIVKDATKEIEASKRPQAQAKLKAEIEKATAVQAESTVGAKQVPGPRGIPKVLEEQRITAEIDAKVVTAAKDLFVSRSVKRDTSIKISDQISDLIDSRQITIPEVEAALIRHNVSVEEFRALLRQDVTDAAKRLGRRGLLVQQLNAAFRGLETTEELLTFRQQLRGAKTMDMVREAWYNALLSGPPTHPEAHRRNAVVVSTGTGDWDKPHTWGGALDRSPCGTGTCAKMAVLHAKGQLGLEEDFCHESVLGTLFTGRLLRETKVGDYDAVVPTLSGRAWITGFADYVVDAEDPFPEGFTVGD